MITYKTEDEIAMMRQGGKILASILKKVSAKVKPGATTGQLEILACDLIKKAGGRPSFKDYKSIPGDVPFPTALCTSINNEVVHAPALPSRELESGDIIGIDIGMEYPYGPGKKGYYTDMAVALPVGKIGSKAKKLLRITKKCLDLAIKQVKPGKTINDIGNAIQTFAEANGFSVVRDLVGHGVGFDVHEDPQVFHFRIDKNSSENVVLKPGMTIAIEPMINAGGWRVKYGEDTMTIITADGSLSAQFEHTVAVTKKGCEVITRL